MALSKTIKAFTILVVLIIIVYVSLGVRAASIYPPDNIPFSYDPNIVNYKLIGGVDVRAGQEVIVDVNCYDPDNDPFMIEVLTWKAGMNCTNGTAWRLKWTPGTEQSGLHYVDIQAKDFPPDPNDFLTDRGTIVFNVRPRNRAPILLPFFD